MKKIILLAIAVLGTSFANAQYFNAKADMSMGFNDGFYFSMDFYGQDDATFLGFGFGGKNFGNSYESIGYNTFSEDVTNSTPGFYQLSLTGGHIIWESLDGGKLYAKGALGYRQNTISQDRYDRFGILGNNGSYTQSYTTDSDTYYQGGFKYVFKPKNTIWVSELFYSQAGVGVGIGIGF